MNNRTWQVKYHSTLDPLTGKPESIEGPAPKGMHRKRRRRWNGPRGKGLSGTDKTLGRISFDAAVKYALS